MTMRLFLAGNNDLPIGPYEIQWWDSQSGEIVKLEQLINVDGKVSFAIPDGVYRDIAAKII